MKGILLGLLIYPLTLLATTRVDSLKALLVISTPEEQVEIYLKLSEEYRMTSSEQSIAFLEEAYSSAWTAGDLSMAAKLLSRQAQLQQEFKLYQDAIKTNQRAAALYESIGDSRRGAICYANVGSIYSTQNQFLAAKREYEKALNICLGDSSLKLLRAIFYESIGTIFYFIGKFEESLPYHKKALMIFIEENSTENIAKMYYLVGANYSAMCHYEESIEYYYKSIQMYEQLRSVAGIATIYHALALVYEDMGYHDKSLDLNLKALEYSKTIENFDYQSSLYKWIGSIYANKKEFSKSIDYLNQALIIEEKNNDNLGMAITLEKIGWVKYQNRQIRESLTTLKKSLLLLSGTDEEWRKAKILISLGTVYSEMGDFSEAVNCFNYGIKIAEKNKIRDFVLDGYGLLANHFNRKGEEGNAYLYLNRHLELKDSLYLSNSNQLADVQLKYESEKREAENEILRKQNTRQKVEIQKQQTRLWQMFVSLTFFTLFFGVGYYHFYKKVLNNRYLFQKLADAELHQKEAEQHMVHRAALTTLGELAAGIIHDLKQPLQDIKLSVEDIQQGLGEAESNSSIIQEALNDINHDVERMTTLTDYVILSANKKVYEKQEWFSVNNSISNAYRMVRKQLMRQRLNLVFSLQDGVSNVRGNPWKFEQVLINLVSNSAHAILEIRKYKPVDFKEKLIIRSFKEKSNIVISVEDNGIGVVHKFRNIMFYPFTTSKKPGEGSGLGLSIVYNVVREMQGRLDCKSTPFVGTRIQLIFPSEK